MSGKNRDAGDAERARLVHAALRASYATIGWSIASGVAAAGVGIAAGSLALVGLGFNVLLDMSASIVIAWRFHAERRDPAAAARVERLATRVTSLGLSALATALAVEAVRALLGGEHPEQSAVGAVLAAVSLLVLPVLATWKRRLGTQLRSPSLRADGALTAVAAMMAGLALLGLLANNTLGWWWADRVAALVVAAIAGTEGWRTLAHARSAAPPT
ncbi:MAG: cation transporter [Mycobacteriales bacterium]